MIWTIENNARVTALWATGLSASKIATEMGTTKGSIIGQVHRLDLASRPSPIRNHVVVKKVKPRCRPVPAVSSVTLPALVSAPVPEPVAPVAPKAPEPAVVWIAPARVTVPSHERCTWLDGDRPRTFRQCTAPVVEHGSWCAHHRAIVYPGSARRDAARKAAA